MLHPTLRRGGKANQCKARTAASCANIHRVTVAKIEDLPSTRSSLKEIERKQTQAVSEPFQLIDHPDRSQETTPCCNNLLPLRQTKFQKKNLCCNSKQKEKEEVLKQDADGYSQKFCQS